MHPMQENRFPEGTPIHIRIATNATLIGTAIALALWLFM